MKGDSALRRWKRSRQDKRLRTTVLRGEDKNRLDALAADIDSNFRARQRFLWEALRDVRLLGDILLQPLTQFILAIYRVALCRPADACQ